MLESVCPTPVGSKWRNAMQRCLVRRASHFHIAALLLCGVILSACASPPASEITQGVVLARTDGAAQVTRDANASDLLTSVMLLPGDQLSTTSTDTATVQFLDGSTLKLGPASRLTLS